MAQTQLALLLAATGWLAGGPTARAETIIGTFQYADFNPATPNVAPILRPIQFCKVQIDGYRQRGLFWSWALEVTTTTDANGSISVPRTFQDVGVTYRMRVFAENNAASVVANQLLATGPFWQEPGFPDNNPIIRTVTFPGAVLNFSYDFTDWYTPQHWSMADAVRLGFDYVNAQREPAQALAQPLPQAAVHPGNPLSTFYNPVNQTLEINNSDIWEDFTILHEYAHFVEHHIGSFAPIPAVHDGCTADLAGTILRSPEHAWMEGFAEFFAQVAASKSPPGSIRGHAGGAGTFTISELENTPWACPGLPADITPKMIENVVAGVLWDLFDAVGACGTSEVGQTRLIG